MSPSRGLASAAAFSVLMAVLVGAAPTRPVVGVTEDSVTLHHSFASATGWVKPGEAFPLRTFVTNDGDATLTNVVVTITPPPSATITRVHPIDDVGTAAINGDGTATWRIASLGNAGLPATLVTEFAAASLEVDPRVAWKDLSSTATLSADGLAARSNASHGPKVIPPTGGFESARYGDKPFPVVTVAYRDRAPRASSDTAELDRILNSPDFEGSTFNLYQEMSYGQLYPEGRVPSSGIASASWEGADVSRFTTPEVGGACRGTTFGLTPQVLGTPLAAERIIDGWYQLPGDTEYYGGDDPVFPYGLLAGVPQPHAKDTACGSSSKLVYDSALIADNEIDYNDFDSDRDGVVDFFMVVFVGCGGNGASQLGPVGCEDPVPYDNVWPHSSSLEFDYSDPDTGLRGFVSSDQLRSIEEVDQCWTAPIRREFDDCEADGGTGDDDLPVLVRVGPYNVNPEEVFSSASVISHEYGHHLGLPDFYNSNFDAGGTFELMASDYSQHMTVFSKQDLGWVVPAFLAPGESRTVTGWQEIKRDTGEIQWWTPDGTPYVLSAANGDQNIHNGQAYGLRLPGRITITDELFASGGSPDHVWYSGRGNDFGCPPTQGHNLDLKLPELADVPAGATVTLRLASAWDIEWDWDYGFVLGTTDGENYQSFASDGLYTTPSAYNPNASGCLTELDNGLTGSSAAYKDNEPLALTSRVPGSEVYGLPLQFVDDSFDISALAGGGAPSIRFAYFTDPAFDRPGWFIDDVEVLVDGEVIWSSDFETDQERTRLYPGGCDEDGFAPSVFCTAGWTRLTAGAENPADHAYYLELRDRSGFDFEGHRQSGRGIPTFDPGLFVAYTDEDWGYGNNSLSHHPAQHYLDSSPIVGDDCPASATASCNNASFTDESGRDRFSDAASAPWEDNFNAADGTGPWTFGYDCLEVRVTRMVGEDTVQLATDLRADAVITAGEGCVTPSFMTAAAGGEVVVPPPPPTPEPEPEPSEPPAAPLPVTGGSLALLGALSSIAALGTRRRRG